MNLNTQRPLISIIAIVFLLSVLTLFGCNNSGSGGDREPINTAQRVAPDFSVTTIDGESLKLSDFKGKKAVIVDIWATWCPPCKQEMPILQKFYEEHSDKVEIIAASQDAPPDLEKVKAFIDENKITFKVVHDTGGEIGRRFPTRSIPFLIVIDKEGNIVDTYLGFSPSLPEKLKAKLSL